MKNTITLYLLLFTTQNYCSLFYDAARSKELQNFFEAVQKNKYDEVFDMIFFPESRGISHTTEEFCNATDEYGRTALHMTALFRHKNTRIARLLINLGANINAQDHFGYTPLHFPNNINVSLLLIKKGAQLNGTNSKITTPLRLAQIHNNTEKILALERALRQRR